LHGARRDMISRNWATNGHTGAVEPFVFRKPCTNGIREARASKTVTLSVHLWLRFGALWFAVVLMGFIEGYVLLPFGLATFLGAVFLTVIVVWRIAPKWPR
jgi:hypothetical protein